MTRALIIALVLSPFHVNAQTPPAPDNSLEPCVLTLVDSVWRCVPLGQSAPGDVAGGIGSGIGSGGSGTSIEVPSEFSALPKDTQRNLSITRENPATLRFDNPEQLRDFKNRGFNSPMR